MTWNSSLGYSINNSVLNHKKNTKSRRLLSNKKKKEFLAKTTILQFIRHKLSSVLTEIELTN